MPPFPGPYGQYGAVLLHQITTVTSWDRIFSTISPPLWLHEGVYLSARLMKNESDVSYSLLLSLSVSLCCGRLQDAVHGLMRQKGGRKVEIDYIQIVNWLNH